MPNGVELVIAPRARDLGGFSVGRVLPYAKRRMVGPFVFFDVLGPADFAPGTGIDVRPHPHIGLATVTYLFNGEMRHRDSLGYDQVVRPGDVNWMTAGRGITHSERTDDALRRSGQRMHGFQSWVALPEAAAETAPAFHHHPKASLPLIERDDLSMRLIAGNAFGAASPVEVFSPMFYLSIDAKDHSRLELPTEHEERAIYIVSGAVRVDGADYAEGRMLVFDPDANPAIELKSETKLMLLGGAPLGPRIIWWNFVAATQDRIDQAKADWIASSQQGFDDTVFALPPDEEEFIPLPA